MRDSLWTGEELNFRHAPGHYGAIHFHDSDLYDCGWRTDFSLTVPAGTRSGFYAAKLTGAGASFPAPLYDKWINTLPNPEEMLAKITRKIPFENRMTTAEEIANMVTFLLSDKSSHITGQLIYVDGGYVHLDRAIS